MKNGQVTITLVVDYEYDERDQLDEMEIATKAASCIGFAFGTIEDGLSIEGAEAFYEDTNIMNY